MVIGDPYKFGFLIERVEDWEYPPFINGLMFLYLNEKAYPERLMTTTLSTELPELLDESSPLVSPKEDKKLFYMDSDERFDLLALRTFPENIDKQSDLSYLVPFHEINDAGFAVFTLSDGESVMITVGKWDKNKLIPIDEKIIEMSEYKRVIDKLREFNTQISSAPKKNDKKGRVTIHKIKK